MTKIICLVWADRCQGDQLAKLKVIIMTLFTYCTDEANIYFIPYWEGKVDRNIQSINISILSYSKIKSINLSEGIHSIHKNVCILKCSSLFS